MFNPLLICIAILLTLSHSQFGTYGCLVTLNTPQSNCPLSRQFQMSMLIGTSDGGNSDDINLYVEFYDKDYNQLITLPLKWPNCNSYEKGNIDAVRVCSSIIEQTTTVMIRATKSDEVQIQALTMSLGERIATKTRFWFDDIKQGNANYVNWPVYSQLEFNF